MSSETSQHLPVPSYQYTFLTVYLCNSRLDTGETFGFVHVEASVQGLPIVAFDTRANGESIQPIHDNGSKSSCGGVGNALLPYREGLMVPDLALALLRAYIEHRRGQRCRDAAAGGERISTGDAHCVGHEEGEAALPILSHWNTQQHSRALCEALQLLLS